MATFTNFCCRSGGSNLNAGTRTGDTTVPGTAAALTYASGTWVNATGVFTVASGNPLTDGVAVGDFASVYPDASTVTPFVGRVTARDATTITVSLTAKMGTAPADGTTNTTLKIGGAWKGPNAASGFPFGTIQSTLTNVAGNQPRVNFMNDATYSITAAITHNNTGPTFFEGFSSSYGDGGRFILDGGTSGSSYILLSLTNNYLQMSHAIFQNNGASGSADGTKAQGIILWRDCVFNSLRGNGVLSNLGQCMFIECEAYSCNQSNTGNTGGFRSSSGSAYSDVYLRCIAHGNTGSNGSGFVTVGARYIECIADSNGQHGFFNTATDGIVLIQNCEAYNNGADGIRSGNQITAYIENCNFIKNGGWGINLTSSTANVVVVNCGFGTGTQVNASGTTSLPTSGLEIGSINYASGVTPWTAPTTGNFSINLAAAENVGRGTFTETAASYTGTVGFPDIGAATHQASSGGGGGGSMVIGLGL